MADKTITERLQPALLDRLTDEDPGSTTESRDHRVIDVTRLREIIRRDLSWLLNTNNLDTRVDEELYPNIARSTLNYGVREVTGDYATEARAREVQRAMRRAIELFEPRLKPGTLDVILRQGETQRRSLVAFDIIGEMWAKPLPMELYLRSEVDLTTGYLDLVRMD